MSDNNETTELNGIIYKNYHGWSNHPTWAAKLWIDNDEGTASEVNDLIKATPSDYEASKLLQSCMEDPAMDILEDAGVMSSLMPDLMAYACGAVDWQEIVEAIRGDTQAETE
jgi:hypothetical protein